MPNPFKYLQIHREEKEREVHRQLADENRAKEQEQQRWEQMVTAAEGFDGMVKGVLNHLQEAFYPDYSVHFKPSRHDLRIHWSIGEDYWVDHWDGGYWVQSKVSAELIFDKWNRPTGFLCSRSGGYNKKDWWGYDDYVKFGSVKCDLSEKALVNALIKLHPPKTLGKEGY